VPTFSAFHVKHFLASKFWRVSRETFFVKKTKKSLTCRKFRRGGASAKAKCKSDWCYALAGPSTGVRTLVSAHDCENFFLIFSAGPKVKKRFIFDPVRRSTSAKTKCKSYRAGMWQTELNLT